MSIRLPRNAQLWLPGLLKHQIDRLSRRTRPEGPIDILFCLADHYEPDFGNPGLDVERERVKAWVQGYPRMASRFADSDGRPPRHTFFYPAEKYTPEHLDALAGLCRDGYGEVEVHLHHDNDTSSALHERLAEFRDTLFHRHGLLRKNKAGEITFGFIHGNWALDNSREDGRWCGVNDELTVLRKLGCYADFTLPAAPDTSQTRTVNSIYYAVDDPARPRSHEYGVAAAVGVAPPPDGLLMIQGPLTFDWQRRIGGVLPGMENGAVDASPAHHLLLDRFRRWVDVGVSVEGRPDWVFIKVHTHGAKEDNAEVLLGEGAERFHADINRHFNDGTHYRLHYVTAWEMAKVVRAAELGCSGSPGEYFLQDEGQSPTDHAPVVA
ncbi:MAG: hypothetical protein ABL986_05900 [Vicinamibacterales bacterium]